MEKTCEDRKKEMDLEAASLYTLYKLHHFEPLTQQNSTCYIVLATAALKAGQTEAVVVSTSILLKRLCSNELDWMFIIFNLLASVTFG